MTRLLLLFIAVPAVELALLIELGRRFGTLHTLALIVLTGIVGAALVRRQGLRVLGELQTQIAHGEIPACAFSILVHPGIARVFGAWARRVWGRLDPSRYRTAGRLRQSGE